MSETTNHHHGHHGAPKVTGFHKKLKEGTQSLHDQAESGNFQVRMVNGELARLEFSAFLGQMRHVHATVDPAMTSASKQDERVGQIFHDAHLRLHRIDQDLKDLDCTELADPLPATSEFVEFVSKASVESPVSMIGVLYVKEGATNGNKFIAKKLRETMGLDEGKAMGYLDPHGKDQRRCWNAFKEQLNELDLTEQEEEKCLEVAQETFKMVMNISKQIPVAHEPAAAQA